jgi:hypothetical protein
LTTFSQEEEPKINILGVKEWITLSNKERALHQQVEKLVEK